MSIAENGDASPAATTTPTASATLKINRSKQIWDEMQNSEFYTKARDKGNIKGKCGVCEYKEICGGCRTAALFYTGDIFGSDPRCAYIPKALEGKSSTISFQRSFWICFRLLFELPKV